MSAVSKWSIGQRLGAGFALALLLLGALIVLMGWHLAQNDKAGRAVESAIAGTHRVDELERALLLLAVSTRDLMRDPTPEQRDAFEVAEQRLGASIRALETSGDVGELAPLVSRYASASRSAVAQGDLNAAELVTMRKVVLVKTRAILEQQDGLVAAKLHDMQSNRESASHAVFAGAAGTCMLLGVIAFFTIRSVRVPARELVGVAAALRGGDWQPALALAEADAEVGAKSANEMAQIGRAFGAAAVALEIREQRLGAHAAIAGAAGASLDRGRIGEAVLRPLLQHVGAEVGALYVTEEKGETLVPVAARCVAAPLARVHLGEGLVGQCARDAATLVWRDIPPDSPFAVGLGHDSSAPRNLLATPIVFGRELTGVLIVASLHELDDAAVSFLKAAAAQVSVGLMNARAYEEMQTLLARIQAQSEQIHAQNEELQAQNEEIQAQNEELQAQSEEIQAQNEDLQRQSHQLHQHAAALGEADARKNEFLGVLAHELRNPLTPIANCVELLSRRSNDPHAVATAEDILRRQVRHMTHLIDDLLDVTRISRGKVVLKRERVNVIELVNECLEDQREAVEQHGIALALDLPDVPIQVDGDHTRLCQVFSNLLVNAIKFCQPGATVSVKVSLDAPQRRVTIHVSDTGEGIEPDCLPRIFEAFYQADSDLARTRGGLGLGLALARRLVELHGGRIDARSQGKGHGAEFLVSLPLAEAGEHFAGAAADGHVTSLAARQTLSTSVLVIDDNADAAASLAQLLALEGCRVEVAHSARSAIEAALQSCPDVIFCDIGLPVMDGYAFARRVREEPKLHAALLVALTGYSSPEDKLRATEAGFDVHVAKPPEFDRLLEILRSPAAARRRRSSVLMPGELT